MKIMFKFEYQMDTDNIEGSYLFYKNQEYIFNYGVFYSIKEDDEEEEVTDKVLLEELNNYLFDSIKESLLDDILEGFTVNDILEQGEIIKQN